MCAATRSASPMCLVDDGTVHLRRHLNGCAKLIVDADFNHVRLSCGDFGDHPPRFVRRFPSDNITRHVNARTVQR